MFGFLVIYNNLLLFFEKAVDFKIIPNIFTQANLSERII